MNIQKSYQTEGPCLYLVPTPIGNLEDMTFRAVRILQEVDLILAEDTRKTGVLLKHYAIKTRMMSFHEHSSQAEVEKWADYIHVGHSIALVSDAGMPLINDPGHPLVQALLAISLPVVSLPGANAATTALVASGLPANTFTYYGFFPRNKTEQVQLLNMIGKREETAIFYESPYRLKQSIQQIDRVLGPETNIVIAREISKKFEEYLRGSCQELIDYFEKNALKGECVLLLRPSRLVSHSKTQENSDLSYKDQVLALMDEEEISAKRAIKKVAQAMQVKKQEVYAAYHDLNLDRKD
ncbi:16S rRNA (cytidine(1402)-2'-O)-methyltransferase [Facklamia miroungae]|uniref:Ribosomal RNA small subunit methyltransferase I n=1 Tax=Facklamia miroungae TaxID=120956 RepID=A0A1G7SM07_9LACT|nr:16S rRNA (cytidine(1402)-2'-O)-methyltransferase [Facklamia miroungae]NKZ29603.1 16S rRNA (cytidine(1402)-2'-O)-methyltransferase [Facklamia miroungae]SDG24127.1 16S rRNA (cytidine1402-2'-O)-methyltransferase [Facklamia miroungae]